jgi:uncharacterized protein
MSTVGTTRSFGELWIDGFKTAMRLRPQSWAEIADSDEDTRSALAGLIMLADINRGDSRLSKAEIDDLTKKAPELIPFWVPMLNAWRIAHHVVSQPETPTRPFTKVGRNDPCPCGSGKKYKKCCGLN